MRSSLRPNMMCSPVMSVVSVVMSIRLVLPARNRGELLVEEWPQVGFRRPAEPCAQADQGFRQRLPDRARAGGQSRRSSGVPEIFLMCLHQGVHEKAVEFHHVECSRLAKNRPIRAQ